MMSGSMCIDEPAVSCWTLSADHIYVPISKVRYLIRRVFRYHEKNQVETTQPPFSIIFLNQNQPWICWHLASRHVAVQNVMQSGDHNTRQLGAFSSVARLDTLGSFFNHFGPCWPCMLFINCFTSKTTRGLISHSTPFTPLNCLAKTCKNQRFVTFERSWAFAGMRSECASLG